MSGCDGSGRLIGCPGCGVCEEEMEDMRDAMRAASDALQELAFNTRTRPNVHWAAPAPDADPWRDSK